MTQDVPVLIVGGGPVGLTLGIDLAIRGIDCLIVEQRREVTRHPKATLLGARSMELLRRWGLDEAVFGAAVPPDCPYAIVFTTRLAAHELGRFTGPSIADVRARDAAAAARFPELAWSPYGKTQIGQQALEPVLRAKADAMPGLDLRLGARVVEIDQDADGVTATLEPHAGGPRSTVRAAYAVACDGGGSRVRKALGIRLNGRGAMRANVSFYFRAPGFLEAHGKGLANLYFVFAPDSFGVFTAIDGVALWNYQHYFLDPAKETHALDPAAVLAAAMGKPFDFELLATTHWHHHQSVAARYRSGRVFLAGDAAHLFCPTGGVGMNTGIGDACDLGWKLAAVLQGWGGEALLGSYEAERKPVAVRNSLISAGNSDKIDMVMAEVPAGIDAPDGDGQAARHRLSATVHWLARQFNSTGTHLGYRYADSPVIVADGTAEPPDDTAVVVPSTWPGSRLPHAWLPDGRSTLDLVGRDFALLVSGSGDAASVDALVAAFAETGVPIRCHRLDGDALATLMERPYVLVRPDGHVGWRSRHPPAAAAAGAIVQRLIGRPAASGTAFAPAA